MQVCWSVLLLGRCTARRCTTRSERAPPPPSYGDHQHGPLLLCLYALLIHCGAQPLWEPLIPLRGPCDCHQPTVVQVPLTKTAIPADLPPLQLCCSTHRGGSLGGWVVQPCRPPAGRAGLLQLAWA
jgi:hypothetical protein